MVYIRAAHYSHLSGASAGLHFRAFYLLTFAASHDVKETIDKDYCECGIPLETVRESEAPLKERSERV